MKVMTDQRQSDGYETGRDIDTGDSRPCKGTELRRHGVQYTKEDASGAEAL